MAANLHKDINELVDASNVRGLAQDQEKSFSNEAVRPAKIRSGTKSGVGDSKEVNLMFPQESIPAPQSSQSYPRRVLDTLYHQGYAVSLFYEGKSIAVELYGPESDQALGKWTMCTQKRHTRKFQGDKFGISVSYRPAYVEVRFIERGKKGLMKKLFAASLESHEVFVSYRVCPDGNVLVCRPSQQYCVS